MATILRATILVLFAARATGRVSLTEWRTAVDAKAAYIAEQERVHVSGSGPTLGSRSWAPDWLQHPQETGLYFVLAHPAVHELRRNPNVSEIDIARMHQSQIRGRGLADLSELSYALGDIGNSFYITVALGSANQIFDVMIDTGSELFWIQCQCVAGGCETNDTASHTGLPLHPPFDISKSSSLQTIPCKSSECQGLGSSYGCNTPADSSSIIPPNSIPNSTLCEYEITYGDGSYTVGTVYKDKMTVGLVNGSSAAPLVTFGCGSKQGGNLNDGTNALDGLMGFGVSNFTVQEELAAQGIAANAFSICLESSGAGGHLVLGRAAFPSSAEYTPLEANKTSFWQGRLDSIQIGNNLVDVGELVIFDSGSSTTTLPASVYNALLNVVNALQPLTDTAVGGVSTPCFIAPPSFTLKQLNALLPPMELSFPAMSGSGSVTYQIPSWLYTQSYVLQSGDVLLCFSYPTSMDSTFIIGDTWLENKDILYDAEKGQIGWVDVNCTSGDALSIDDVSGSLLVYLPPSSARPALVRPNSASSSTRGAPALALTLTHGALASMLLSIIMSVCA